MDFYKISQIVPIHGLRAIRFPYIIEPVREEDSVRKILHMLEKASFLKKLFFALLALVLTVTVLLTCVLLASYHASVRSLTSRYFSNLLKQCNYSITYMNDLAQRLSLSLAYNHQVISFQNMDRPDSLQAVSTHQAVRSITLPLPYVDSVYLYNRALDLVLCTRSGRIFRPGRGLAAAGAERK